MSSGRFLIKRTKNKPLFHTNKPVTGGRGYDFREIKLGGRDYNISTVGLKRLWYEPNGLKGKASRGEEGGDPRSI